MRSHILEMVGKMANVWLEPSSSQEAGEQGVCYRLMQLSESIAASPVLQLLGFAVTFTRTSSSLNLMPFAKASGRGFHSRCTHMVGTYANSEVGLDAQHRETRPSRHLNENISQAFRKFRQGRSRDRREVRTTPTCSSSDVH